MAKKGKKTGKAKKSAGKKQAKKPAMKAAKTAMQAPKKQAAGVTPIDPNNDDDTVVKE